MTEIWRAIPGYPGYEASDLGRIRSLRGRVARILKGGTDSSGYRMVCIQTPEGQRTPTVHRLVALAHIGPKPSVPEGSYRIEVCHENGDRTDNRLSNLRYDTNKANQQDSMRHGTHTAIEQAAKTHCVKGHEYTAENTYYAKTGRGFVTRSCRKCIARRRREYVARQKAQAAA